MDPHIQLTQVSKIFRLGLYKKKIAVEDLSLTVPSGKVIGLLGPNGSGKSTTIKMIMGFLRPSSGEITVCGNTTTDPKGRSQIGYLPENPRFQKFLKGRDVLHYYGKLTGMNGPALKSRTSYLLDLVGLGNAGGERVQGYSKGMTQRLALAQALLNQPSLLIFDEPMSGLDPLGRMEIRKLISTIHNEMPSSTIFFSSHILEDVEQLCAYVALLRKGKLKTFCALEELLLKERQHFDVTVRDLTDEVEKTLEKTRQPRKTALGLSYLVDGSDALMTELEYLKSVGATVVGIGSHKRKLEEALFRDEEFTEVSA